MCLRIEKDGDMVTSKVIGIDQILAFRFLKRLTMDDFLK